MFVFVNLHEIYECNANNRKFYDEKFKRGMHFRNKARRKDGWLGRFMRFIDKEYRDRSADRLLKVQA